MESSSDESDNNMSFDEYFEIGDEDGNVDGIRPYMFEPANNPTPANEDIDDSENTENILNETLDVEPREGEAEDRIGNIGWCRCGECREMDIASDCVCCKEMLSIPDEFYEGMPCISKSAEFSILCCRQSVLKNVLACIGNIRGDPISRNPANSNLRYAAYRQYIWWIYQHLGRNNRRIIPSCVLWAIRDKYPEESGNYVPFKFED